MQYQAVTRGKHQNLFYSHYVLEDNDNARVHLTAFPQKASPVPADTESSQEVAGLRKLFVLGQLELHFRKHTSLNWPERQPKTTAQLPWTAEVIPWHKAIWTLHIWSSGIQLQSRLPWQKSSEFLFTVFTSALSLYNKPQLCVGGSG